MGKGTISYKGLPIKGKRIYGDSKFYIVPKSGFFGTDGYYFVIRPETDRELLDRGYKYQLEGECCSGEASYKREKEEQDVYGDVRYTYYKEDVLLMSDEQRIGIEKWLGVKVGGVQTGISIDEFRKFSSEWRLGLEDLAREVACRNGWILKGVNYSLDEKGDGSVIATLVFKFLKAGVLGWVFMPRSSLRLYKVDGSRYWVEVFVAGVGFKIPESLEIPEVIGHSRKMFITD